MVLPESALISNFTIKTGGKVYISKVERKKVAQNIYQKAVGTGQAAGIVDQR